MNEPRTQHSGLGTWVDHHAYSIVSGLGRVFRKQRDRALPKFALYFEALVTVVDAVPMEIHFADHADNSYRVGG